MITSNNEPISEILKSIDEGKTQLPDFQRGWVWEDNRIRALIASISNGYPIGAAMFLQTGSEEVNFKARLFEGVDASKASVEPERLVLDGQQRNTSIYRSMYCKSAVETVDLKKKPIKRFYYLHIPTCLDTLTDRIDAVISVPETKMIKENIGRDIVLDLSSPEKEYQNHCFPLNIVFDSVATMRWQRSYTRYHDSDEVDAQWDSFFEKIIATMIGYHIPVIQVGNDVPKEAVCQVFENVNQGGVSLTVFELVTATFAASNFELRKDWDSIWKELGRYKQFYHKKMQVLNGADFLTAITLLASYENYKAIGKAVSCKKRDVLRLTYEDYARYRDRMIQGFKDAAKFLTEQRVFSAIELPYSSQLIPLSVAFAIDPHIWFNIANKAKLVQWYWCGVFGELYGGANETRYVNDIMGLMAWTEDDKALPETVVRSNFHASRLQQLCTRNSAAYKGVMALILKEQPFDFLSGSKMDFATFFEEETDIHHIFPENYCNKKGYDRALWNSVINKTPIYARTNRIIGGVAPSQYISSLERNHSVNPLLLDTYLASHQIDVAAMRSDDFFTYFEKRKQSLLDLIEKATGKVVSGRNEFEGETTFIDSEAINDTEDEELS
ncbi:MAG: DUF262 domain-containing protein [Bacteroidaceae bacterium]|nr:DUF262 domain-containing protein [Bacteroidaceae bacterium]MCF0245168.1 DUF262 domain-containing protein [Bacteroidaceae bacterium]